MKINKRSYPKHQLQMFYHTQWKKGLNSLPIDTQKKIMLEPSCEEAKNLAKIVDEIVKSVII